MKDQFLKAQADTQKAKRLKKRIDHVLFEFEKEANFLLGDTKEEIKKEKTKRENNRIEELRKLIQSS